MTTCLRCKRPLTNPASVINGMGPVCHARAAGDAGADKNEAHDHFLSDPPLAEYLFVCRMANDVYANVPHAVRHHSPSGFEFGYGGSGPADLALNLAIWVARRLNAEDPAAYKLGKRTKLWDGSCDTLAYLMHQDLKWRFIAGMDRQIGGKVPTAEILEWAKQWHASQDNLDLWLEFGDE